MSQTKLIITAFVTTLLFGIVGMIIDSNVGFDGNLSIVLAIATMGAFIIYSIAKIGGFIIHKIENSNEVHK